MANVFTIDGEDAGSKPWEWTQVSEEAFGVFELSSANPYEGTYAYRMRATGTGEGDASGSHGRLGFAAETEIYFVGRMCVSSGYWVEEAESTNLGYLIFEYGATQKFRIGMKFNGSANPFAWWFYIVGGSSLQDTAHFSMGAYHLLQAHLVAGASGIADCWVDGVYVGRLTADWTGVSFNYFNAGQKNMPWMWIGAGNNIDFDYMICEDAQIAGYNWNLPSSFRERARRYVFTTPRGD